MTHRLISFLKTACYVSYAHGKAHVRRYQQYDRIARFEAGLLVAHEGNGLAHQGILRDKPLVHPVESRLAILVDANLHHHRTVGLVEDKADLLQFLDPTPGKKAMQNRGRTCLRQRVV